MLESNTLKIWRRLLTLCMLLACLVILTSSETEQVQAVAPCCGECDIYVQDCHSDCANFSGCNSNDANCLSTCLSNCLDQFTIRWCHDHCILCEEPGPGHKECQLVAVCTTDCQYSLFCCAPEQLC